MKRHFQTHHRLRRDVLRRPLVAVSLAVLTGNAVLPQQARLNPANLAATNAKLAAIAFASGRLQRGSAEDPVSLDVVRCFVVSGALKPALGQISFPSELALLKQASEVVSNLTSPALVTWSSFDPPFLYSRGFAEGMHLNWVGANEGPAIDCSELGAQSTDVRCLLSPEGPATPLEKAMAELALSLSKHVRGVERLELLAVGTFALVTHVSWQFGTLDDDGFDWVLDAFSQRLKAEARHRPHLGAWTSGIKCLREPHSAANRELPSG